MTEALVDKYINMAEAYRLHLCITYYACKENV